MLALIVADRALAAAIHTNMQPAAHHEKGAACNVLQELTVNTMIDSQPYRSPVSHLESSFHDDLPSNQRRERKIGQTWALGAYFPNAHAFPDNPLRTAEDYLLR